MKPALVAGFFMSETSFCMITRIHDQALIYIQY